MILVIFIVSLATILITNLAYSTHLRMRTSQYTSNSLQAEYLLKSLTNFARLLIQADQSQTASKKTPWGLFADGRAVPPELLDIKTPNINLAIEIQPQNAKLPINLVMTKSQAGKVDHRRIFVRLFKLLGFDNDQEEDQTGFFPKRVFSPEEMVANLIDYMDTDKQSYNAADFASGIESELPEDYFPGSRITRFKELEKIPGFTPARLRKLQPLVTTDPNSYQININLAPKIVLQALHDDISAEDAQGIVDFRNSDNGPFNINVSTQLATLLDQSVVDSIQSLLTGYSKNFQVLTKVEYGTSTYFMRTTLSRSGSELPRITSLELF
ncbi:MAG: hypothetical protein D6719_11345 [Candidatus Dadabacteria bacterium]|nr:MAG: hypothetical protein D6719_11345 [Candidatus Dadabacteria bacterium]